jgi:hypothetical protein
MDAIPEVFLAPFSDKKLILHHLKIVADFTQVSKKSTELMHITTRFKESPPAIPLRKVTAFFECLFMSSAWSSERKGYDC